MSEKPRQWFKGPEPKNVQLLKKNEYPSDLVIGGVCKPAGPSPISCGHAAKAVEGGFRKRIKEIFGSGAPKGKPMGTRLDIKEEQPMGVEAAIPPGYRFGIKKP